MRQPPYDQLYIYEVLGDARPWVAEAGPAYLGLWLEDRTSFIFFASPADELVAGWLAAAGLVLRQRHHMTYEQWQGGLEMEPIILEGLAVLPAWSDQAPPDDRPHLRLDPGLVFGNGLHPTTRHCLELLVALARRRPLGAVLDLGCGTGILALAAARLGGSPVTAVDLNPLCVTTTRANAELNRLELAVIEGSAPELAGRPADTLLANIHWEVQAAVLARPENLRGKRDLILSGLMRSQRGPLEDLVTARGYQIIQRREAAGTWFTLWARSKDTAPRPGGGPGGGR